MGDLIAPVVKIEGADIADDWANSLVDIRIELGFRVAGRATLRFADPEYAIASSTTIALGNRVEIHARDKGLLMRGDITGVSVEHQLGEAPDLVIVVHDKAYKLALTTKVATYLNMKFSDVVEKLASEHSLSAKVTATSNVLPHMFKADSDLALLDALADRAGFDWWVDGNDLHFEKPAEGTTVELQLAKDLLAFSVRASGLHASSVKVDGWDHKQTSAINAQAASSDAVMQPTSDFVNGYAKPHKLTGSSPMLSTVLAPNTQAEATELSQAALDRAVAAAVTARGVMLGDPRIKLGVSVKINDAGPLSGKYHVTQVEHVFRASGFETRFVAGERRPRSLVDTLAGGTAGTSGASGQNASFHHDGLVFGMVTNVNDPDKLGRVKVKFPVLSDKEETDWARVVMLGAGKKRGAVFVPEVGDEVLVGFENGDVRHPVVIGGLYSSKTTIPKWDVERGEINSRSITSRLGHVIEFGDGTSPDKQHVLLELAGNKTKFRLGKDKVDLEAPSGVPIVLKSGEGSITIGKDGSITISGTSVTIQGQQKVAIESKAQAELKGTAGVTIQTNAQAALKGSIVQVEGQGMTEIKGGLVKIN